MARQKRGPLGQGRARVFRHYVLEQEWHAREWRVDRCNFGSVPRALEQRRDDGIQFWIQSLDPADRSFHHLRGRHFLAPNKLSLRSGIQKGQFVHGHIDLQIRSGVIDKQ